MLTPRRKLVVILFEFEVSNKTCCADAGRLMLKPGRMLVVILFEFEVSNKTS